MTALKRILVAAAIVAAFCACMFLVVIVLVEIFGYRWLFQ